MAVHKSARPNRPGHAGEVRAEGRVPPVARRAPAGLVHLPAAGGVAGGPVDALQLRQRRPGRVGGGEPGEPVRDVLPPRPHGGGVGRGVVPVEPEGLAGVPPQQFDGPGLEAPPAVVVAEPPQQPGQRDLLRGAGILGGFARRRQHREGLEGRGDDGEVGVVQALHEPRAVGGGGVRGEAHHDRPADGGVVVLPADQRLPARRGPQHERHVAGPGVVRVGRGGGEFRAGLGQRLRGDIGEQGDVGRPAEVRAGGDRGGQQRVGRGEGVV